MKPIIKALFLCAAPLFAQAEVCDKECFSKWASSSPAQRISPTGPILSFYGGEGKGDGVSVARCRIDVLTTIVDDSLFEDFIKQCQRLYPVKIRQRMYYVHTLPRVRYVYMPRPRPILMPGRVYYMPPPALRPHAPIYHHHRRPGLVRF